LSAKGNRSQRVESDDIDAEYPVSGERSSPPGELALWPGRTSARL
jgi:hypothetical protein